MASKLLTLAEVLFSRGAIARTSTAPNSWATVALWRRFFEEKKREEEEEIDEVGQILLAEIFTTAPPEHRPAASAPIAKNELQEFSKQYYREILAPPRNMLYSTPGVQNRQPLSDTTLEGHQVLNQPNLSVPVGDEFLYLAQ